MIAATRSPGGRTVRNESGNDGAEQSNAGRLDEEVVLDEVLEDEDGVLEGFDEDEVEWEVDRRTGRGRGGQP